MTEAIAKDFIPERSEKNGYVEPFRMLDNVFYIGDKWASSYLIKTSAGLVLLETLESPFGRWIPDNIKKLGLNPYNIKYILVSHGHSDHVGNAEYIQRLYGGKVVMSKEALALAKAQSEKSTGQGSFHAPEVSLFAEDGDKLVVGDTEFNFYMTPGHTAGSLSIDFMVKDAGISHRAFMVGGHSPSNKDIELTRDFIKSMKRIRALASESPRVSINLANHPHKNSLFEKRDSGKQDDGKNYFIDSQGFFDFLDKQEELGRVKLSALTAEAERSPGPSGLNTMTVQKENTASP
ncbi:MBL fold metallo-hydrolase [Oceanospirillum sediminis]|nr:MBL fold metallo-hydrolase [Oceanospirillum sediminis]